MFIKSSILVLLFSLNLFAQVVQTFPIGFHALEKAQSIAPDYAEAITQASQMVGRVLSNVDNGTAYLFYNDEESRWEAHSAYHVVQEEMEAKLPLVMELVDKTWITLDPNNIISSDDEHSTQDRVRYTIDYSGEKPNKIIFTPSYAIESGMAMVEVGYPNVMHKVKVSFGHALMLENNTYWLSTLTSQPGSSGSPVWLLAEDGKLALLGTVVIANDFKPFILYSYRIEDKLLYTVLSMANFNEWIINASDPYKKQDQTFLETRHFFNMQFLEYYDQIHTYPKIPRLFYQANYSRIKSELKDFLERGKKRVELDPYDGINAIREGLIRYYASKDENGFTQKVSSVDFPLLSQTQMHSIAEEDLKTLLLSELDKSIENLDYCEQKMQDIGVVMVQEQLKDSLDKIKSLDLQNNAANFSRYHVPMMTSVSSYP